MSLGNGDTPSKSDAPEGARLAANNAKELAQSAQRLEESDQHGHALSLAVLSIEEAIKAFALASYATGLFSIAPDEQNTQKHFHDLLSRHDPRHLFGQGTLLMMLLMKGIAEKKGISSVRKDDGTPNLELVEELSSASMKRLKEVVQEAGDGEGKPELSDLASVLGEPEARLFEIWDDADEKKKRGLYVDLDEGEWLSPQSLEPDSCREFIKLSEALVDGYTKFVEALNGDEIRRGVKEKIVAAMNEEVDLSAS
jgi:AbiV family abortive infection protein